MGLSPYRRNALVVESKARPTTWWRLLSSPLILFHFWRRRRRQDRPEYIMARLKEWWPDVRVSYSSTDAWPGLWCAAIRRTALSADYHEVSSFGCYWEGWGSTRQRALRDAYRKALEYRAQVRQTALQGVLEWRAEQARRVEKTFLGEQLDL